MSTLSSQSKYNYDHAVLQLVNDFHLSTTTSEELITWLAFHFAPTTKLLALVALLQDPSLIVKSKEYYKSRGIVSIFVTFFDKKTGQVSLRSTILQAKVSSGKTAIPHDSNKDAR